LTDTIPNSITGIINEGPIPPGSDLAIWAGQGALLSPLAPLEAIAGNLTQDPSLNPIQLSDLGSVFTNGLQLIQDNINDFNPFQEGSFLYWGAAKDYSIPSALGGTLQDFTGIPNQWGLANLGAEPVSGYTSTPLSLPGNFLQGFEYFLTGDGGLAGNGLLGYLNPETYLQALSTDIGTLTNPNNLLASLPLVGFLGLGNNVPGAIAPGSFLGTFAPGYFSSPFDGLFSSFDSTGLLSSFDATGLTTDLSGLLPNIGTDLASMLGSDLGSNLGTTLASNVPDLALQLLTSF
jgi:hypothetical protein